MWKTYHAPRVHPRGQTGHRPTEPGPGPLRPFLCVTALPHVRTPAAGGSDVQQLGLSWEPQTLPTPGWLSVHSPEPPLTRPHPTRMPSVTPH